MGHDTGALATRAPKEKFYCQRSTAEFLYYRIVFRLFELHTRKWNAFYLKSSRLVPRSEEQLDL